MLADIALRPWSACTLASILCVACLIQFPDMVVGIQAEQSVLVDELPGRQLLIPGAENIALRQAQTSRNVEYARNRSPYLVRVQHPVGKDLLQSLHDVAGKDIYYAPHDTYIVSMTHEEMGLISQKEGVIGVFLVPTEMKVEYPVLHALRRRRGDIQTSADPVGRLHSTSANNTVTFIIGTSIHVERDPSYRAAFMNSVQADIVSCGVGGEVKLKLESSTKISCEITDETEALWKIVHCIASAWWSVWMTEKPKYHALNYYSNRVAQSGSLQTPIWDAGLRGEGEVIGMADTGLDWDGCFFFDPDEEVAFCLGDGALPDCVNVNHRKIVSYRTVSAVVEGDTGTEYYHAFDKDDHGTHVAGTIAGSFLDGESASARENGVAPDAKIAIDDIDDRDENSLEVPSDLVEALFPHSYQMANARIHSNSWGSSDNGYSISSMDIDAFMHANDDFLVLVAAGNDGDSGPANTVGEPATSKNCLAVGSTENTPEFYGENPAQRSEDVVSWFSSVGPSKDGRIKPEVFCVGSDIASAAADSRAGCPSRQGRAETVELSGTSMATPACAGAAALVREYCRKGFWPSGSAVEGDGFEPSAALVKAMLISSATARPIRHARLPRVSTPSRELGFGRVDLSAVLKLPASPFALKLVDRHQVVHGQFRRYSVTGAGAFRVTLVWTDPPSFPSAARNLVNNLDLRVELPDGSALLGNDFAGAGLADALNNVEHVTVPAGTVGTCSVYVLGTELQWFPQSQLFSLVVAGDFVDGADDGGDIDGFVASGASCGGTVVLRDATGSVSDGSALGGDYSNNLFCQWIIAPSDASLVTLSVDSFETQRNRDVVEIFQCIDESCLQRELLARLSGTVEPREIRSLTGTVMILFSSDDATTKSGFTFSWTATMSSGQLCDGVVSLTEASGTLSSGTPYANSMQCQWILVPTGATSLELTISLLETEQDYDFVKVYQCASADVQQCAESTKKLAELSGSMAGSRVITAPTGAMRVDFTSDNTVTSFGFTASWVSTSPTQTTEPVQTAAPVTAPPMQTTTPPPAPVQTTTPPPAPLQTTTPPSAPVQTTTPPPAPVQPQCTGVKTLTDPAGNLRDGSGPAEYQDNLDCVWVIAPDNAIGVVLDFAELDVEKDYDFVQVYECDDVAQCLDSAVSLVNLTGSVGQTRVQSSTAAMKIVFTTDGSIAGQGFLAAWGLASVPCPGRQIFTGQSGSFKDGDGVAYTNNLECEWIISPPMANSLELTFSYLETEEGYDHVKVFSCENGVDCLLASLSGSLQSETGSLQSEKVESPTGLIKVVFTTDATVTNRGFAASWSVQTNPPQRNDTCSGVAFFNTTSGSFGDGSGSDSYGNNMYCEWVIAPPGAASVELVFTEFDTEEGYDYVAVFQCEDAICNDGTNIALLTGSQGGTLLQAASGFVIIVFMTDESQNAPGFFVEWSGSSSAVEPACSALQTFAEVSGMFEDGSGPAFYANDLQCSWIIAPPTAFGIVLDFLTFNIEDGYDFLEIYECENEECLNATLIDWFTGTETYRVRSSTGVVKFVFTTDDTVTGEGFSLTWALASAPCSGTQILTDSSGSFADGGGGAYANNLQCEWIIAPPGAAGIVLDFSEFDIEDGYDYVDVYECENEQCLNATLVDWFTGTSTYRVQSSTGVMRIEFLTDDTIAGEGFLATWALASAPCSGTQILTDSSGSFADGDGVGVAYANNLQCEWIIAPPGAAGIVLDFSEFDIEDGYDYVDVYECENEQCLDAALLGNFSGSLADLATTMIQSSTGVMRIVFTTDESVTGMGFTVSWVSESIPATTAPASTSTMADTTSSLSTTPAPAPTLKATTTLIGMTLDKFDEAAESTFKQAVVSVLPGKTESDVTITGKTEVTRRRATRALLAMGVKVEYEISGFGSQEELIAAAERLLDGQNAVLSKLQEDAKFADVTGILMELDDSITLPIKDAAISVNICWAVLLAAIIGQAMVINLQ